MIKINAQRGNMQGVAVARTVDGEPKLNKEQAINLWPKLKLEDRVILKRKFDLDLETK